MLAILQQQSGYYEAWEIPKSEFFLCAQMIIMLMQYDIYLENKSFSLSLSVPKILPLDLYNSKLIHLIKFYFVTQFCGTDEFGS